MCLCMYVCSLVVYWFQHFEVNGNFNLSYMWYACLSCFYVLAAVFASEDREEAMQNTCTDTRFVVSS